MIRAMTRASLLAAACALAVLVAPPTTAAQEPSDRPYAGSVPSSGGLALLSVREDVPVEVFVRSLASDGCEATTVASSSGGALLSYIPGAPPFVNRGFPSTLDASSAVVVRCARPVLNVPDVHLLTLVTKEHGLEPTFVPDDLEALPPEVSLAGTGQLLLTAETLDALTEMLDAAREAGHEVVIRSAYRSYAEQVATHDHWVRELGPELASRRSAEPGHSEHQLGTVVDLTSASVGWQLEQELGDTPEGRWLARNAWRYGFVMSYPEGGEEVTGYAYEPWHLRYIGETHAEWMRLGDLTLTEYLTALGDELG